MIGYFGDISFKVSSDKVLTFKDLSKELKNRYVEHSVLNSKPILEYTGRDLETISLSIDFLASFGVHPLKEYGKLEKMFMKGESYSLYIGNKNMGKFVIESMSISYKEIDNKGNILKITAGINLKGA